MQNRKLFHNPFALIKLIEFQNLLHYTRFLWGAFLRVLGERLNGIQEVKSSILSVSTTVHRTIIFLPIFWNIDIFRFTRLLQSRSKVESF